MKNLLITLVLGIIGFTVNAQKVIEKTIDYKNQEIILDVKFAHTIEVKTWDKSTIYFKADIQMDNDKFIDLYELDIKDKSNKIIIKSDAKRVFKATREDCIKNNSNDKRKCYNTGDKYKFNYVLYVPKNATFMVSSINGTLKSDRIEGDFEADLINGNIEIASYSGNLKLNTINGAIDLNIVNAEVTAETINGDIYADEKLNFTSSKRNVGQKISGKIGGGKNKLQLNTINGNMYLR